MSTAEHETLQDYRVAVDDVLRWGLDGEDTAACC